MRLIGHVYIGTGSWEFAKMQRWERRCVLGLLRKSGVPVPKHVVYDACPELEPEEHWRGRIRLGCMQVGANDFGMNLEPNGGDAPLRLIEWWHDPNPGIPQEITLFQVLHYAQGMG